MADRVGEEFDALIISTDALRLLRRAGRAVCRGLVPIDTLPGDRYAYHENAQDRRRSHTPGVLHRRPRRCAPRAHRRHRAETPVRARRARARTQAQAPRLTYHQGVMRGDVQLMTGDLFGRVLEQARSSPRRRMNFNFHSDDAENPSRLLNVMLRGTYIRPHRHLDPPKAESFVVLEGRIVFLIFDDAGQLTGRHVLGPGAAAVGIDIAPGVWHTAAVLTPHAVCFEVKPGPYVPAGDKAFAPWAPREGDPGCAQYLESLLCGLEQS